MSEQDDKYAKQAKELLPCWPGCHERLLGSGLKVFHVRECPYGLRPAVAAALRAQGELLSEREKHWSKLYDDQRMSDAKFYSEIILRREAEIKAQGAEIERLNVRLSCGHRKLDWKDSYGDCVACQQKGTAFNYDQLPRDVIEAHDKIMELEAEIERLLADPRLQVPLDGPGSHREDLAELRIKQDQLSQLRAQLADCLKRLDMYHVCGYMGNQPEPCATCEYIKDMAEVKR